MLKEFIMKQLLKRQLKDMPPEQQAMIMKLVNEHPDLFKKIAEEIEHKVKKEGRDQTAASFEVMRKYQSEIQKAMMNSK